MEVWWSGARSHSACCGWHFLHTCCSDIFRIACFDKRFTPQCSPGKQVEPSSRDTPAPAVQEAKGLLAAGLPALHCTPRWDSALPGAALGLFHPASLSEPPSGSYSSKETGKARTRWHDARRCQARASLSGGRSEPELKDINPGTARSAHGGRWPLRASCPDPNAGLSPDRPRIIITIVVVVYYYYYIIPKQANKQTCPKTWMFCYASLLCTLYLFPTISMLMHLSSVTNF